MLLGTKSPGNSQKESCHSTQLTSNSLNSHIVVSAGSSCTADMSLPFKAQSCKLNGARYHSTNHRQFDLHPAGGPLLHGASPALHRLTATWPPPLATTCGDLDCEPCRTALIANGLLSQKWLCNHFWLPASSAKYATAMRHVLQTLIHDSCKLAVLRHGGLAHVFHRDLSGARLSIHGQDLVPGCQMLAARSLQTHGQHAWAASQLAAKQSVRCPAAFFKSGPFSACCRASETVSVGATMCLPPQVQGVFCQPQIGQFFST